MVRLLKVAIGCVATSLALANDTPDRVTTLPKVGTVQGLQYAGFAEVNAELERNLFYWFVEATSGSKPGETPTLIWMNGGPGASSMTGLLVENIGPFTIGADGSLTANNNSWTKYYNVLAIDNPVGSGYSYTGKDSYVKTEEEMRKDYHSALEVFFKLHPEYQKNPIWVTGESYGGKYVPNVAYEIHVQGKFDLQGVIIGNGVYSGRTQWPTVPDFAYAQGLIDDKQYAVARQRMVTCVELIDAGKNNEAANNCEDTVRWIYADNKTAGGIFYYDVGLTDGGFLDHITDALSNYLNDAEVRKALHVGDRIWQQSDETGPVADNLLPDFVTAQGMTVIEALLDAGKGYRVVTYNGVRDGSMCNHIGNLLSMNALKWSGQAAFQAADTAPWRLGSQLVGYERSAGALTYITLRNTGHLVPMIVPETTLAMVRKFVDAPKVAEQSVLV